LDWQRWQPARNSYNVVVTERILFLAGIPGSGKSTFGRWLQSAHGVLHIDAERDNKLVSLGLKGAWDQGFVTGSFAEFTQAVHRLGAPVILDWGFPVGCLNAAIAIRSAGFSSWWFEADLQLARREFLMRGDARAQSFDSQVLEINRNREAIDRAFHPNIIEVLSATGGRLAAEVIWARMTGAA
jgi:hypothetical protein